MGTTKWVRAFIITGVLALVAGIVIIVTAPQPRSTFGWFAYAPLSGESFSPGGIDFVPLTTVIGIAVCAVLTFVAGFTLGCRRAT